MRRRVQRARSWKGSMGVGLLLSETASHTVTGHRATGSEVRWFADASSSNEHIEITERMTSGSALPHTLAILEAIPIKHQRAVTSQVLQRTKSPESLPPYYKYIM